MYLTLSRNHEFRFIIIHLKARPDEKQPVIMQRSIAISAQPFNKKSLLKRKIYDIVSVLREVLVSTRMEVK